MRKFDSARVALISFLSIFMLAGAGLIVVSLNAMETPEEDGRNLNVLCVKAIVNLTNENSLLCEREVKMVRVVATYEEQNRALTSSLSESVEKIQAQEVKINEVIDENTELKLIIKEILEAERKQ